MTNEEIRIKIAQAKGWYNFGHYSNGMLAGVRNDAEWGVLSEAIPNWPENIADAWELFEEMPTEKALKKYDDKVLPWMCFCDGKYTYEVAEEGATAPLAICASWLAWDAARKEEK